MPKKVCPNGHIYDSSIYGDICPLCPKGDNETHYASQAWNGMPQFNNEQASPASNTRLTTPAGMDSQPNGNSSIAGGVAVMGGSDAIGETKIKQQHNPSGQGAVPTAGRTIIRPPRDGVSTSGRKLVGLLITYNRNPLGKVFNIYEGKNYIGRDSSCDISVPEDNQMSGRHMSILYRNVDNKFKFRDEQSSNGTFVNKELTDEGELKNYDIIRIGSTIFIFIAIPKIM